MIFEWDTEKNRSNEKKHSIRFETALRLFSDPRWVIRKDRVMDGEQRWHGIGPVGTELLLAVHVYREETSNGENIVRIISARKADPRERRIYLEQASD